MARPRRAAASRKGKETDSGEALTCPECGKTFSRAASLGAHRSRAHGVAGVSSRRRRGGSHNGGTKRRRSAGRTAGQQTAQVRSRAGSSDGGRTRIDRDALLRTLFPKGVPPRQDAIRRVNAWLDEAEQLASMK